MSQRWIKPPQLRSFAEADGERHATWLELFFDLVFVVAIAQLAGRLHHDLSAGGFLTFAALFVPVWWAWMGLTFYADQFDTDDVPFRVAVFAAMLCILTLATNIDDAFGATARGFAGAYVAMRLLLLALYLRARRHATTARGLCTRFVTGITAGVALWSVSLVVPEPLRYALWALALTIEIATPIVAWGAPGVVGETVAHASHIPERFGLFTLIVLGEAIVAVAIGAAGTDWQLRSTLVATAGLAIAACLWWLYFDRVDGTLIRRSLTSAFVYGYGHLPILAGLTAVGAGTSVAIEHAGDRALTVGMRAALCGGVAVYLLAVSMIQLATRRSLHDSVLVARLAAAAVAGALVVVGGGLDPLVPIGILLVALVALTVVHIAQSGSTDEHGQLHDPVPNLG